MSNSKAINRNKIEPQPLVSEGAHHVRGDSHLEARLMGQIEAHRKERHYLTKVGKYISKRYPQLKVEVVDNQERDYGRILKLGHDNSTCYIELDFEGKWIDTDEDVGVHIFKPWSDFDGGIFATMVKEALSSDFKRENIVDHYSYGTRQDHINRLKAEVAEYEKSFAAIRRKSKPSFLKRITSYFKGKINRNSALVLSDEDFLKMFTPR